MHARAIVALLFVGSACAPMPKHPIAVAVVHDGPGDVAESAVTGLALHPATLPPEAPPVDESVASVLVSARRAYATGEADRCREQLATLDLPALLARGNRAAAARALALDTACAYQGLAREDAARIAARLAVLGLDLPADAVAREAEDLIVAAIATASAASRAKLEVTGVTGARVSVDGRPATCVTPCPLELVAGDHVISVDADGYAPAWKTVRVPDSSHLAIEQQPAPPALAGSQWRARVGRGLPPTDAKGAELLALALAEPRIAYLAGTTGVLIVDGTLRATGSGESPALLRELAYDGGLLQRPKVWQRPWFWIVVAGATAVVSGAVIYTTYQPEIETMVRF